ncbi:MAG: Lrp/AsnC family transcriptional regulator [Acidilobaceae archaeon]|nr:Lrp/AsnC family transcriptional regulator [Acidilobaceae archaeon]MCX8165976.1 Lrp/AsnC family transcriptional regulator [Acidilobaceae archaeon]
MRQLESYEEKAIQLIKSKGSVLQSELWKMLSLDSREGSRLVQRLIKRGLVGREEVTMNGRRTFRLVVLQRNKKEGSILINIESIIDLPCTVCPQIDQCEPGNSVEPGTCAIMDNWLDKVIREGKTTRSR